MATADPKKKKKKRKKKESLEHKRNRILVALGIFAVVYALDKLGTLAAAFGTPGDIYASFVLFLVPFLIAGYDVLQKAFNNIRRGKAFDESFLMAVATIGAFAMVLFPDTDPHMAEGAAVMLFYQVGELFQAYAVGKSRKSISAMMDIAPDYANVEQPDGTLEQVFPDDIAVGTVIVVKPGERVPIDGVIVEGIDNCPIKFAKCCSPLPGDEIIGFVTRGFGVSIHKRDCANARESMRHPENADRWVHAYWDEAEKENYKATLDIVCMDRANLVSDVALALGDMRVPIYSLTARAAEQGRARMGVTVGITNTEHLNSVVARLKKIKDVVSVTRN